MTLRSPIVATQPENDAGPDVRPISAFDGTLTVAARLRGMTDLNSASLADITAAGFEPGVARELALWGPYRSWEQLLWVGGIDEAALERLRRQGFEITAPDDKALAPPKPFRLSTAAR